MSKVKIQTLTPIHIGSGEFLKNNSDFITYNEGEKSFVSVVDPRKILNLIGVEQIKEWVNLIEKGGDMQAFIAKYAKNVSPRSYALRILENDVAIIREEDTLKECIHDGMGVPYIPGSSIKGAIRTAIVATLTKNMDGIENSIVKEKYGKKIFTSKQIEADILGADPNSDVFRFVKVGDAYFNKGCEHTTRLINLNIKKSSKKLLDTSKSQLVETIGVGVSTEFQMTVDKSDYERVSKKWSGKNPLGKLDPKMNDMKGLFSLINKHTHKLVEEEINNWNMMMKKGFSGVDNYLKHMKQIMSEIKGCTDGECILRIGHASGWRFITGAWTENLDNFKYEIVPASRLNNFNYQQYDFPKSRRLDEKGEILGFVKLSLV